MFTSSKAMSAHTPKQRLNVRYEYKDNNNQRTFSRGRLYSLATFTIVRSFLRLSALLIVNWYDPEHEHHLDTLSDWIC